MSPIRSLAAAEALLVTSMILWAVGASTPAGAQVPTLLEDLETTGIPLLIPPPITAPPWELPGSNPSQWLSLGQFAVFSADDRLRGAELWATNGTIAGTRLVLDLAPGPASSAPLLLGEIGGGLAFFADDDSGGGHEPWWTDGETTVQLAETCPGACDGYRADALSWLRDFEPGDAVRLGDRLVFVADRESTSERALWETDGTPAGTREVGGLACEGCRGPMRHLIRAGDRVVFFAGDVATGTEPWSWDGTTARPLGDLCPGEESSNNLIGLLGLGGERVLLATRCGTTQGDLWVTDGTAEGTEHLAELPGRIGDGAVAWFWRGGDLGNGRAVVHLIHFASSQPNELWVSDGTAAGTGPIFVELPDNGYRASGTVFGNRVAIATNTGLWISDGTEDGTFRLPDVLAGVVGAEGSRLFFEGAREDGSSSGLWTYVHRPGAEPRFLGEVALGAYGHDRLETAVVRNGIAFSGWTDPAEGAEVWLLAPGRLAPLPMVPR